MDNNPSPPPKITLVGYSNSLIQPIGQPYGTSAPTSNLGPLEVIAIIWLQSKTTEPLEQIINRVSAMTEQQLSELMENVLSGVPVVEAVSFNFIVENASISWREQMVRHRVGTKADSRVGVDWQVIDVQDIGDVADMSAWSQSMRLMDMSNFAARRAYRTPYPVIDEGLSKEWHEDMVTVQELYAKWAKRIPLEDARDLIPLGATSRLSWTINLRTLQHIVGKRGCTILQLGLWGDIIMGIIGELSTKIHPVFASLVTPPCMKGDKYTGCIFPEDIQRRYDGRDWNLPVCPLFIGKDQSKLGNQCRSALEDNRIRNKRLIMEEADKRRVFWNRDPWTGVKLNNENAIGGK